MATYRIENDGNNPWVKLITVSTDSEVDITSSSFRIVIKDLFEYFTSKYMVDDSTYELSEIYQKDIYPTLNINNLLDANNTVEEYNNNDVDSLIKNGFQFWTTKKNIYMRLVAKGKSTKNITGYILKNPINSEEYESRYVGFNFACINLYVNDNEFVNINCPIIPVIDIGTPIPSGCTDPSTWSETPHVLSGDIRTDFKWDVARGQDQLYVNNCSGLSAFGYEQEKVDGDWKTTEPTMETPAATPLYIVESSAYTNEYLSDESTIDLYASTTDNIVTADRDFNFQPSAINSYLYNETTEQKIKLEFEYEEDTTGKNVKYISANSDCISGKLYCGTITQKISNSATEDTIRANQIRLEMEI